ncbi:MAG: hypothetical protein JKY26_10650 [Pseudomonas sp.]|jgi:hypothetical protein|nr:hypothetical protein [Pseudomonas sp.]|tara:strand:- start:28 stop:387 length:360 start_codon:yes stop_codon:yes gene_type:complete
MHLRICVASALLVLTGCTEADPRTLDGQVGIYQDAGSTQCQEDGLSLEQMQQQLREADIPFADAACGTDGKMYTAMCGSPDGKIGMFQIAPEHLQQARALGFEALANVPEATEQDCAQW